MGDPALRVGVHDASRIEWLAEIPLPGGGATEPFDLDLSLEIPAGVWSPHEHWERFQLFARLASPSDEGAPSSPSGHASVDELRRSTLTAVQRLKVEREALEREIFTAASLFSKAARHSLADDLLSGMHRGIAELHRARAALGITRPGEPPEVTKERELAAEFLSHHALEFLSKVQRGVDEQLTSPRCRHKAEYDGVARTLAPQIARALADELTWRAGRGLSRPDPDDPYALERYVERASTLKKHFQEVLFLKLSAELLDRRLRNWLGVAAAILAALWAFPLGLILTTDRMSGFGLGFTATITLFAAMYAVKDRIKEVVRSWLTDRLREGYAGRVTLMTTPGRLLATPIRLCKLRESFKVTQETRPDPVNPEMGATRPVVVFRYVARGSISGDPRLAWQGMERVKLVFRYDLSPLFSRLDDAVKRVPVLTEDGKGVRFAEAPRSYRLPIQFFLRHRGETHHDSGLLVTHKLGLERIERPTQLLTQAPDPAAPALTAARRS